MRSNHRVRKTSLRRTVSAALPLFLIVASFVTPLAAAQAADSPTGATIASDKADYAPGELVTLTGAGWAGDTTVNIEVNDTLGKSWQRIVDVPVVDGNITDAFNLPDRFVSDYDVTAKVSSTASPRQPSRTRPATRSTSPPRCLVTTRGTHLPIFLARAVARSRILSSMLSSALPRLTTSSP